MHSNKSTLTLFLDISVLLINYTNMGATAPCIASPLSADYTIHNYYKLVKLWVSLKSIISFHFHTVFKASSDPVFTCKDKSTKPTNSPLFKEPKALLLFKPIILCLILNQYEYNLWPENKYCKIIHKTYPEVTGKINFGINSLRTFKYSVKSSGTDLLYLYLYKMYIMITFVRMISECHRIQYLPALAAKLINSQGKYPR